MEDKDNIFGLKMVGSYSIFMMLLLSPDAVAIKVL